MTTWALVPARGGAKSIPHKNLALLAGLPLLDYGVRAAQASGRFDRIVCSTDDPQIANRASVLAIEVDHRPQRLAADETPVAEVACEWLGRVGVPDLLVLVQPTSPFLTPDHVRALLDNMAADEEAHSGQTVARCPHNHHAWNQREVKDKRVTFRFAAERSRAYNKQTKPAFHVFGNLVGVRGSALMAEQTFFVNPSLAVEIPAPYDFDLDRQEDLVVAEALIATGVVNLPHMDGLAGAQMRA